MLINILPLPLPDPLDLSDGPCRACSPPKVLLILFKQGVVGAHAVPLPVDAEHVAHTQQSTGAADSLPPGVHLKTQVRYRRNEYENERVV